MKTLARQLTALCALACAALPARGQFTTMTVDPAGPKGSVGRYTSQAILANGNPAICYEDNLNLTLKFATNSAQDGSGVWTAITIPGANVNASLVIVNGNPAICYGDGSSLYYRRAADAAGSDWSPASIKADGLTQTGAKPTYASLAVVDGMPAIAYYDSGAGDLKYVRGLDVNGTGAWGPPVTIDTGGTASVGIYPSLVVVNGNPAISYLDNTNALVKYVRATDADGVTAGAWGTPISVAYNGATGAEGDYISLAVVNGNPAISYLGYTTNNPNNFVLKYVRASDNNGGTWPATQVTVAATGNVGEYSSLAVVAGNPSISFYGVGSSLLYFVRASDVNGVNWPAFHVIPNATTGVGRYDSLSLVGGKPAVAYYDATNGNLKFARNSAADGSGTWTVVDADVGTGRLGLYTSQTVVNGAPAISYYDAIAFDLKFARNTAVDGSGTWVISTVDSAGDVGQFTSLAVVNGNPAISYYDNTNHHLKFARNSAPDGSGAWNPSTVDTSRAVGQYNSLAVINGNPAITYYDAVNRRLQFARNAASDGSGTWTITTIDSIAGVAYNSLASVNGMPAVAYYNANLQLKFAINSAADGSGVWNFSMVDTSSSKVGEYCSLAVVSGNPAISYYDNTNGHLKFARNAAADGSGAWNAVTVDSATLVGYYTSLAVINGNPAISYDNFSFSRLIYARNSAPDGSGTWILATADTVGDVGQYKSLAQVAGRAAISYFDATNGALKWAIQFSSNADLSTLTLSVGGLSPGFDPAVTSGYTATVPNATVSLTVTAGLADATASVLVRVNGGAYVSAGTALALNVGANTVDVQVTAQDGTVKTYSIAVTRQALSLTDDTDGDGLINLLELAFGLDPNAPDSALAPRAVLEAGYLTFTLTKHTGVTYEVQSAGTPLGTDFSAATTTVLQDDATTLKVRDNTPYGTPPGRFMRVKVTAAP